MFDLATIAIVSATFVLAGLVKGVIGMGLPTVSLAILTAAMDLPAAMALLLAPSLITNAWQALSGGHLRQLGLTLWPFLLPAMLTVWVGVNVAATVDVQWLSSLLGLLLIGYAIVGLYGVQLKRGSAQNHPINRNSTVAVLLGGINGLLTGLTGSFVVPGVMYLQSLNLPRDQLIQAMGMLFTASTLALGIALAGEHRISQPLAWLSLAAIGPAIFGMVLGRRIRRLLSEQVFRRLFFFSVLLIGIYIVLTSLPLN